MEGRGEGSNDCLVRVRAASSRLFRREESARGIEATLLQWSAQARASFCVVKKQSLFSSESRAHFFLDIFFSSALFFYQLISLFLFVERLGGRRRRTRQSPLKTTPVTTPPVTTRFFGSSSFSRGLFRLSFFFPSSRTSANQTGVINYIQRERRERTTFRETRDGVQQQKTTKTTKTGPPPPSPSLDFAW